MVKKGSGIFETRAAGQVKRAIEAGDTGLIDRTYREYAADVLAQGFEPTALLNQPLDSVCTPHGTSSQGTMI